MVGNLEGIVSNVCISGEACGTCRESLCPLDLETIIENCPCRTPSFLDAPSLIDQDLAAANCSGVAVLRNTRDLRRSQCRKDVSIREMECSIRRYLPHFISRRVPVG